MPMTLRAGELMVNPLFAGTIEGAVRDEAGEPAGERGRGRSARSRHSDADARRKTGPFSCPRSVPADTASPTGGLQQVDWRATMEMAATSGVVVEVPAGGYVSMCPSCDQQR